MVADRIEPLDFAREQSRARSAWDALYKFTTDHQDAASRKKYRTSARDLPSRIFQNGLLPALAFLKSKSENPAAKSIYEAVGRWLLSPACGLPWVPQDGDILAHLMLNDSHVAEIADAEAIEWSSWLKRFAEGYIEDTDDQPGGGG